MIYRNYNMIIFEIIASFCEKDVINMLNKKGVTKNA